MIKMLTLLLLSLMLSGCPLDGDNGSAGPKGNTGAVGPKGDVGDKGDKGDVGDAGDRGFSCWDINQDGVNDLNEDINRDGGWTTLDCIPNIVKQHPEVAFNFQHLCTAFAELGKYPAGCPSASHVTPSGTLTLMDVDSFDSTDFTTCSNLSVKTDGTTAHWALSGGFIANTTIIPTLESENCQAICASDSKCVASHWEKNPSAHSGACKIMYHSDTLVKSYVRACGIDIPGMGKAAEVCLLSLGSVSIWWARCAN